MAFSVDVLWKTLSLNVQRYKEKDVFVFNYVTIENPIDAVRQSRYMNKSFAFVFEPIKTISTLIFSGLKKWIPFFYTCHVLISLIETNKAATDRPGLRS